MNISTVMLQAFFGTTFDLERTANARAKEHRITLIINKVKEMVYAYTEDKLDALLCKWQQYPPFLVIGKSLWPQRKEWAHCYRKRLLLQGNHTNNSSEAGMKILKELIFSHVKAHHLVQVFHFLTETLESCYCRKLLSISNNRQDTCVALRFQGMNIARLFENCCSVNWTVRNCGVRKSEVPSYL